MLRNFQSVLVTSCGTSPKPLKERSSSMRHIKPTTHSEEPAGFDRLCSTAQRFREFVEESLSKGINSMFVMLPADDERQCEPIQLQFCKSLIERCQSNGQSLKVSIWDVGEFETDATTRSREHISCYDVQFLSEVRRLLNRRQSNRRDQELRLFRFQMFRNERVQSEIVFLQAAETDSPVMRDRLYSLLLKKSKSGRASEIDTFFQQDHALYLMLIASERGKTKQNKHVFQFCADVADKVLEHNRRPSKKSIDPYHHRSQNKENINSASNDHRQYRKDRESVMSNKHHHPSNPNLLEEEDREEAEDPSSRTMNLIAMKRKEGFDRLLMQLEQENRQLKMKLASQKNDFEQQTEQYLQKNNRKVGRLKVQLDEIQESLKKCHEQKQELQAKLQKAEQRHSTRHEHTILQLEKERTELRSELAYTKRTSQLNTVEYEKQLKLYESELENMRVKVDSLQSDNSTRLQQLQQQMEQCLSEHSALKQQSQRQEQQVRAAKQNQAKYLQQISRLEYRFLKERGKYIAEKNNNQKLAKQLQIMDEKLNQIIEIKNREITDLTDEVSDCA